MKPSPRRWAIASCIGRYSLTKSKPKTYTDRIGYVLEVEIEGRPLAEWLFDDLRRRHVHLLLDGEPGDPLFKAPRGRRWSERNFYRDVWTPARIASGMDPTPHEFRHSYITNLRASGTDNVDLAKIAGHRIETMISVYTHPLERSHEAIRAAIG